LKPKTRLPILLFIIPIFGKEYEIKTMNSKHEYSEIRDKILEGIQKATDKLIVKTAQQNGALAFSKYGKITLVKAKDLLNKKP